MTDRPAILLSLALIAPWAVGQDLVTVAPDAVTIEYEDARVRVIRLRIPPNGSLPMHHRPGRVVAALTDNHVRLSRADGTESTTRTEAFRVTWSAPMRRAVTNLANAPIENIVVELKGDVGNPTPVMGPPASPPTDYLADPHHRWLFENQYVRVYDVRIPPGATTTFHRHAHDGVSIFLSGGRVSTQLRGGTWGAPQTIAARSTAFAADGKNPFTHRARNDGTAEYRVILIQLLHAKVPVQ